MVHEVVMTFMKINYHYDQMWKITIGLFYDLVHKSVPKLMSSYDLVPIRDKLATG